MADQCKNCVVRGNIDSCLKTDCGHHENWIAEQNNKRYSELKEVALAMIEWIDAVPDDVQLPAMPGFDRDWAEEILDR
jgi:hypothetical protein